MGDVPHYLGVDPGASGGLAVLRGTGELLSAVPILATDKDVLNWLSDHLGYTALCNGVLERVHSMPGQGVASTFKFGVSYGSLRMALAAAGIPFDEVNPAVWQKGVGIPPRKKTESRTDWKNRLKARAQQLFPGEKVTLATADALLIATFCMRKKTGTL